MDYDMSDPRIRELLDGLDIEDEPEPPPRGETLRDGRYEPSQAEVQAMCELIAVARSDR